MINKRGLSRKTSIIAIIVILVIIIGIIIGIVIAVKRHGGNDSSLLQRVELNLDIKDVKAESDTSASVKVKRREGAGNLIGIEFTFDDGTQTEVIQLNYFLEELQEETFVFTLESINSSELESVSISPIVELEDGGFFTGTVKDEYKIRNKNRRTESTSNNNEPYDPFN